MLNKRYFWCTGFQSISQTLRQTKPWKMLQWKTRRNVNNDKMQNMSQVLLLLLWVPIEVSKKNANIFTQNYQRKLRKMTDITGVVAAWVRQKIVFKLINLIILCISGSRTVANNKKFMIRSTSESIRTSELLSEMNV